jgi:hypothetical protein
MRRLLVLLAVAAASVAGTFIARANSASGSTSFRTPDAGAACRLESSALVCSSLGSTGSVALRTHGRPKVVSELPWWDAGTPVLRSFHRAGLACHLAGAALLCRSAEATLRVTGEGFAVAERESPA